MSSYYLTPLNNYVCKRINHRSIKDYEEDIKYIFYSTSSIKSFKDNDHKQSFYDNWTKYYFSDNPVSVWVALDEKNRVLSYLTGSLNSHHASTFFNPRIKSYKIFSHQFDQFPAHFHINTSPEAQRRGIGKQLIDHFCKELLFKGIPGVHIITTRDAENIFFYQKNHFIYSDEQTFNNTTLYFMGRKLTS
ncbi:MAG: GNAT family N-acetyltransferase [Bdellovibrionales bacterium]|nr:GNAT family N-acetyltransferase [Bdellovibrionales bacterium]